MRASGGDDEPIGPDRVKRRRQMSESDHHFDVERNDVDDADRSVVSRFAC
jgi:hypothetical protein